MDLTLLYLCVLLWEMRTDPKAPGLCPVGVTQSLHSQDPGKRNYQVRQVMLIVDGICLTLTGRFHLLNDVAFILFLSFREDLKITHKLPSRNLCSLPSRDLISPFAAAPVSEVT